MWSRLLYVACALHGLACHHIAHLGVRIMTIHFRRWDQARHSRIPLTRGRPRAILRSH